MLTRLAEGGSAQERKLEIRLAGAPAGPVGLGYLAEMPLWKASWRLVAGQGDGLLQGWAILENASGQDWRDVAVTLIGGSPRALRQALFASHYVQRPEVPVDGEARKERQDFVGDGRSAADGSGHRQSGRCGPARRRWRPARRRS